MTLFEPLIRKLIEASLRKHYDENMDLRWHLIYDHQLHTKQSLIDENMSEVVDYFYKAVLQYEQDKEALQERK
jgi:hypothetical protein